jgi:hypothetical protein
LQDNFAGDSELAASFFADATKIDAMRKNHLAVIMREPHSASKRNPEIVIDGKRIRGNTSSEVAFPLLCFSLNWRTPMEELITAGEVVSGFC